jgi:hypothetical protein
MACEQAKITFMTIERIMRSKAFRRGFAEKRAGRAIRYDEERAGDNWNYERGRQLAAAAPIDMPLLLPDRRLNPAAIALCESLEIGEW